MIRGVLFDLDNTLVDFLRMKRLASAEAARAMIAHGADFGMTEEKAGAALYDHYLEHGIDSDDAFESFLARYNRTRIAYGQNLNVKILAAGVQTYLRAKELFLTPYPGVRRTLVELARRNLRLGVVTDAPRLKGWQRLVQLGVADFFEVVVTMEDTGSKKPDPAPFKAALDTLDLKPFEVLFVGDWPERDIAGARALGLKTAFAQYGRPDFSTGHGADVVLQQIADLLGALDAWRPEVTP